MTDGYWELIAAIQRLTIVGLLIAILDKIEKLS